MLQFVPLSDEMLDQPELAGLALVPYQVGRLCHHGIEKNRPALNQEGEVSKGKDSPTGTPGPDPEAA